MSGASSLVIGLRPGASVVGVPDKVGKAKAISARGVDPVGKNRSSIREVGITRASEVGILINSRSRMAGPASPEADTDTLRRVGFRIINF